MNTRTINLTGYDLLISEEVGSDSISLDKTIETIEKYGFRGHSAGGRNGIVLLNRSSGDRRLEDTLTRFIESKDGSEFLEDCGLRAEELRPVKIVTHREDGKRVIGYIKGKNLYLIKVGEY